MDEASWVYTDEDEELMLVGDKLGMEKLQDAITAALDNGEADVSKYLEVTDIGKIVITSREQWDKERNMPDTLTDKLIGVGAFIWIFILPLVAIGLLAYLALR